MSYDPKKAAQLIAAFILKNGRRKLNVVKAVKLVYLADRESIKKSGFPILDEPHYSMPHGPVNSYTYNFINGEVPPERQRGWTEFIADREGHMVGLAHKNISFDDLDELSEAELDFIDAVWSEHGSRYEWDIVRWTHDPQNIPEWHDPHGGAKLIPFREIVKAVGIANADEITEQYEQMRSSDKVFKDFGGDVCLK